jgi:signal transduction histidine kinase
VALTGEQDVVRWQIKDTGIGIPREPAAPVREVLPRRQRRRARDRRDGPGLYLVRLIVRQIGGHVGCESEEGRGATFYFTVPRAQTSSRASR